MPIVETHCDANFTMNKLRITGKVFYEPGITQDRYCGVVIGHENNVIAELLPANEAVKANFRGMNKFKHQLDDGAEVLVMPARSLPVRDYLAKWLLSTAPEGTLDTREDYEALMRDAVARAVQKVEDTVPQMVEGYAAHLAVKEDTLPNVVERMVKDLSARVGMEKFRETAIAARDETVRLKFAGMPPELLTALIGYEGKLRADMPAKSDIVRSLTSNATKPKSNEE